MHYTSCRHTCRRQEAQQQKKEQRWHVRSMHAERQNTKDVSWMPSQKQVQFPRDYCILFKKIFTSQPTARVYKEEKCCRVWIHVCLTWPAENSALVLSSVLLPQTDLSTMTASRFKGEKKADMFVFHILPPFLPLMVLCQNPLMSDG